MIQSLINENLTEFPDLDQQVDTLILHCNKISSLSTASRWMHLQILDISSNALKSTIGLSHLYNLKSLNLSNNLILHLVEIPQRLRILDVSFNQLSEIDRIQLMNLVSLDVKGNFIDLKPLQIFNLLPHLSRLEGKDINGGII